MQGVRKCNLPLRSPSTVIWTGTTGLYFAFCRSLCKRLCDQSSPSKLKIGQIFCHWVISTPLFFFFFLFSVGQFFPLCFDILAALSSICNPQDFSLAQALFGTYMPIMPFIMEKGCMRTNITTYYKQTTTNLRGSWKMLSQRSGSVGGEHMYFFRNILSLKLCRWASFSAFSLQRHRQSGLNRSELPRWVVAKLCLFLDPTLRMALALLFWIPISPPCLSMSKYRQMYWILFLSQSIWHVEEKLVLFWYVPWRSLRASRHTHPLPARVEQYHFTGTKGFHMRETFFLQDIDTYTAAQQVTIMTFIAVDYYCYTVTSVMTIILGMNSVA